MINYLVTQPLKSHLIQPFIICLTSFSTALLVLSILATQASLLCLEEARWASLLAFLNSWNGLPPDHHITPSFTSLRTLPQSPSISHQ